MIYNWLKNVQDFLLPHHCALCAQSTDLDLALCRDCLGELPRNSNACLGCALPLPHHSGQAQHCAHCLKQAAPFSAAFSPYLYADPLSPLIHQFKFQRKLHLTPLFGHLFCNHLKLWQGYSRPNVILPVPLHDSRLRQRGYNQSLELARVISASLAIPLNPWLAKRHKATLAQSDLNRLQRRQNIKLAFSVSAAVKAQHIAIIDDVMTTTETATALTQALLDKGAAQVQVWTLARAVIT